MEKKFNFQDTKIRAIKPQEKRVEYSDTVVSGMILRVTKTGHKSFAYRYWYRGKVKQITLGKFGDLKITEARAMARDYKNMVREGRDPIGEIQKKKAIPDEITFRELHEIYEGIHIPTLRESSRKYHTWAMNTKVFPYLGKRSINEITDTDITRILDRVAIEGGAQTTANKVRERLHHVFNFAVSRSYLKVNPVSKTTTYRGGFNQRERFYDNTELKELWITFEELSEPVQSYLKILLLTGQRRTETLMMKWDDIKFIDESEFKGWVWVIPKELAKSNRDHEVQLSPLVIEIIRELQNRAGGNPFVFASGLNDEIPIGLKTVNRAVRTVKDSSGITDFKLHDLRRTLATNLARLGTSAEVVSKILNHKTGGSGNIVTRIYNRYQYRTERQVALKKWSYELERIISDQPESNIKKLGA